MFCLSRTETDFRPTQFPRRVSCDGRFAALRFSWPFSSIQYSGTSAHLVFSLQPSGVVVQLPRIRWVKGK